MPGKNVADLGGKPLIAWSVAAGKAARRVDRLILSSDDPKIMAAARRADCEAPFRRPARLAADHSDVYGVLFHALEALGEPYDYIVLLQATSPFRSGRDIDACIELCHRSHAPSAISVCQAAKPPQWMYALGAGGRLRPVLKNRRTANRRQDLPPVYLPNGAVYVARVDWLRKSRDFVGPETRAYVMPTGRSVDIDGKADLLLARAMLADSLSSRLRRSCARRNKSNERKAK